MPFVDVVGEVAEIKAVGTLAAGGSNAIYSSQIYHYRLATRIAQPTKVAFEAAFNTAIQVPFLAAASARFTQSFNETRNINDATDQNQAVTRAGVGAIATDGMSSVVSCYMLLRTAVRGRAFRGSKHFIGVNEVDTTYDVLTGAGLARWVTLQAALLAPITDGLGNLWNMCVFSRSKSQMSVNPTTILSSDVTTVLLSLNVGTMRRRKVQTIRV